MIETGLWGKFTCFYVAFVYLEGHNGKWKMRNEKLRNRFAMLIIDFIAALTKVSAGQGQLKS